MAMSATSVAHLGFVGLIAGYLAWSYPAGSTALVLQVVLAIVSEVLHGHWRGSHRLVVLREALFLAGLAGAWLIGTPLYPLVAFALSASLLLLVRHRALRYLPALCAADLVWCGVGGTPWSSSLAVAPPTAAAAATLLVPLALAALATDAWLAAQSGARKSARLRQGEPAIHGWPTWLWLVRPVLLCALIGLIGGLPASRRDPEELPVQPLRVPNPVISAHAHTGLSTVFRIGDQLHIDRDQRISARLEWNGAAPVMPRMVYLRAITMPEVIVEGPFLLWRAAEDGFTPFKAPMPSRAATGWLLRRPGGGDAVLRPDGCAGVGLDHLRHDRDNNWYQAGIGMMTTTYRVSLESLASPITGEASAGEVEASRRLPRDLRDLPWSKVERSEWAAMTPEDAARDIVQVIHDRCRYELESLPEPDPSPGGALRTFLLSDDPDDRRGHCQYFSTAAVVLLRRAGHPARTVVGFASEEIDAKGVTFRGMHAHAWLELVDSRGRWQRVDATPSAGYLQRLAGVDPARGEVAPDVATDKQADEANAVARGDAIEPLPGLHLPRLWTEIVSGLIGVALVVTLVVRWWRARPSADARRKQALSQANATLYACARELGVSVKPSSTLTEVAEALSCRTGVDLTSHVREHLAARFDHGPSPRPWPLAQLRASRSPANAAQAP